MMHREELALNEIRLDRTAQTNRDISFAHRKIELAIVEQHGYANLRVELHEFRDARREPHRAHGHRGGDPQLAGRLVLGIHEAGLGRGELGEHVMGGAIEDLALFSEDEAPGVAMEQGHVQILLKRADLAAYRRLRKPELMTGMGKAAGFRHRVENPELVPVQHGGYSAASRTCSWVASHFSASSAAMQPKPAAVTACR